MIFPVSHDSQVSRRWPFVTLAIIALNIVTFAFTWREDDAARTQSQAIAKTALEYYFEHPYLEVPQPLARAVRARTLDPRDGPKASLRIDYAAKTKVDPADRAEQQSHLDGLCAEMIAAARPEYPARWGYVPAGGSWLGIVTYQFVHGGWLHILSNLWFLWLVGINMEDAWGRVIFPLFYLSAGAAAAVAHRLGAPASTVPLVGASGAIAGAMGAFMVRYATTKIRFFWLLFFRFGFFSAPAYVMLPLWLATQMLEVALAGDVSQGGVAYLAHVGGFVYGVAFAVVMKQTGLDRKVDDAIENEGAILQDPRLLDAGKLIDAGQTEAALALLGALANEAPAKIDIQLELLRAAKAAKRQDVESKAYVRLLALYLHDGVPDAALAIYDEMRQMGWDDRAPAPLRLRLAKHLERSEKVGLACHEYGKLHANGAGDDVSFQALLSHANAMLRQGDKSQALALFRAAERSAVPHLDWEGAIARGIRDAS